MVTVEGMIASHDKKPYRGVIEIESSGLIKTVSKPSKAKNANHVFGDDCLIFPGFGDVHIHAREDETGGQMYKEEYKTAADAALHQHVLDVDVVGLAGR